LVNYHPVVIITERPISQQDYQKISSFSEVYCISDTLLSYKTFKLASVHAAKSICVLLNPSKNNEQFLDELMIDAEAITMIKFINKYLKRQRQMFSFSAPIALPFLSIEIVHTSNLKFVTLTGKEGSPTNHPLPHSH
jgi:hypothetical protein